jgi:hypothetical protein
MPREQSPLLLSGYLYKLKQRPGALGSAWTRRFVVVEERTTRGGREAFFSYYADEPTASDVRSAREAVPLCDVMHVSPLAGGPRLGLYMGASSSMDARARNELSLHKELTIEVEVPSRIYFLRAEGRADMLMWASGLQRLCALRVDAPWPAHLGPPLTVPDSVIAARRAAGTLPAEFSADAAAGSGRGATPAAASARALLAPQQLAQGPALISAPATGEGSRLSVGLTPSSSASSASSALSASSSSSSSLASSSTFAPVAHDAPLRATSARTLSGEGAAKPGAGDRALPVSSSGQSIAASLASASSQRFEQALQKSVAAKSGAREIVIEGDAASSDDEVGRGNAARSAASTAAAPKPAFGGASGGARPGLSGAPLPGVDDILLRGSGSVGPSSTRGSSAPSSLNTSMTSEYNSAPKAAAAAAVAAAAAAKQSLLEDALARAVAGLGPLSSSSRPPTATALDVRAPLAAASTPASTSNAPAAARRRAALDDDDDDDDVTGTSAFDYAAIARSRGGSAQPSERVSETQRSSEAAPRVADDSHHGRPAAAGDAKVDDFDDLKTLKLAPAPDRVPLYASPPRPKTAKGRFSGGEPVAAGSFDEDERPSSWMLADRDAGFHGLEPTVKGLQQVRAEDRAVGGPPTLAPALISVPRKADAEVKKEALSWSDWDNEQDAKEPEESSAAPPATTRSAKIALDMSCWDD